MATEATQLECKESTGRKEKTEREKHPYRKEEEKHS
jgi:hypothetical protein